MSSTSQPSMSSSLQYPENQHWLQGTGVHGSTWSLDNPWWSFSAGTGDTSENHDTGGVEDTETSESEEEIYTEVVEEEEEELEETVVTDDICLVKSDANSEVFEIIDNVIDSVVDSVSESVDHITESIIQETVDEETDEGISSDQSYYEDTSATPTDSDSAKEDSSDRSEAFEDDLSQDKSDLDEAEERHSISKKLETKSTDCASENLLEKDLISHQPRTSIVETVPA